MPYMCVGLWVHKTLFLWDAFGFSQEAERTAACLRKVGLHGVWVGGGLPKAAWPEQASKAITKQSPHLRWTSANGKTRCFPGSTFTVPWQGQMLECPGLACWAESALPTLWQQWSVLRVTQEGSRGKESVLDFQVSKLTLETQDKVKLGKKQFLGPKLGTEHQNSHLRIARRRETLRNEDQPHLPLAHATQHPGNASLGWQRLVTPALRRLKIGCPHQPGLQREDLIKNKYMNEGWIIIKLKTDSEKTTYEDKWKIFMFSPWAGYLNFNLLS